MDVSAKTRKFSVPLYMLSQHEGSKKKVQHGFKIGSFIPFSFKIHNFHNNSRGPGFEALINSVVNSISLSTLSEDTKIGSFTRHGLHSRKIFLSDGIVSRILDSVLVTVFQV